jgi:hypothetical protein
MQKVISCNASEVEKKTEKYLQDGWRVKEMVAEHVTTSVAMAGGGEAYGTSDKKNTEKGLIVFLLEKSDI